MLNKFFIFLLLISFNIENIHSEKQELSKAYFASGCFWCVESIYENLKGVVEVNSGYSGGNIEDPSYSQVMSGKTGHAETIEVIYDSKIINFQTLVQVFFGSHDPSTLNRQGPDVGTQYRSIAFFNSENEKQIIENEIKILLKNRTYNKITTEIEPFKKFYIAEDYHQDYKKKNPYDLYIMRVSAPRINKFKMDFKDVLK
ncbi:MAG: peptide-methionine (S)-S-oxide reductase [Flavobacteriaceae bacterium]|nr:peptide-methionine (S)-S-oxide reductase [Flavobacteriaceae bacterium]RCL66780.1 MAG: peptide-methionine (S)-S-oxide reductase [Cryomorphaceae bacterium]|tara:strand:- start:1147 stop:1746 length:600 start_codon:yes stop_codon:yes gene_type:complete